MSLKEISLDGVNVIEKRFLNNIKIKNDCWIWKLKLNNGYGRFGINKLRILAHRFSYMFYKGHIFDKMFIHHKCNNKNCVNPEHLEQVTPAQNINYHYNGY